MQQLVQKESHEAVWKIFFDYDFFDVKLWFYVKEKANTRVIYYVLNEWEHFRWQFLLSLWPLCLIVLHFCLHFCILSHFEIIRCIMKSLIATSKFFFFFFFFLVEIKLKKENLKSDFWAPEFGRSNRYTGLPNGLNTSLVRVTF